MKSHGYGAVFTICIALMEKTVESFNIKRNMTESQIETFVEDFLDRYKYESVEDLNIFLRKVRTGGFGQIYESLDGAKLFDWFKEHLEEKAVVRERAHVKSRDSQMNAMHMIPKETLSKVRKSIQLPQGKPIGDKPERVSDESVQAEIIDNLPNYSVKQLDAFINHYINRNSSGSYDHIIQVIAHEIGC